MVLTDLTKWKVLDTEFDLFWDEFEDSFDLSKREYSSTDFLHSSIHIYTNGRKTSELWKSLWSETFKIIVDKMSITEISKSDDFETIIKQLSIAMNCMLQDNKLELKQSAWIILDTIYRLIWCEDWDCIDEDERLYGHNDDHRSIIRIYVKERSPTEIWETFWHECMHSIIRKMPIKLLDEMDHTKDQERIIDQICVPLNKVVQENILANTSLVNFK